MEQDHSSGEPTSSIDKHYRRLGLFPGDGDFTADRRYQQNNDDDDTGYWDGPYRRRHNNGFPDPHMPVPDMKEGSQSTGTGPTFGSGPFGMPGHSAHSTSGEGEGAGEGQEQEQAHAMQMQMHMMMLQQTNRDMATRRHNWL